jgi:hypothetical protein
LFSVQNGLAGWWWSGAFLYYPVIETVVICLKMLPTIFIQIASYRDPDTLATILDALAKAKFPERISIGLCWQYTADDYHMLPLDDLPEAVRLLTIPAEESQGVCWARHKLQALYGGEDFFLSIDSHMRFAPNWDVLLLNEWNDCENTKAVLSCYPRAFQDEQQLKVDSAASILTIANMPKPGIPRFDGVDLSVRPKKPARGIYCAAGFCFGPGRILLDFSVDPNFYFDQEEIVLALKLWTFGYDVFSPTRHYIFHRYKTDEPDVQQRQLHWEDYSNWWKLNDAAVSRFRSLVEPSIKSEKESLRSLRDFPLGNKRGLSEFMEISGLDFQTEVFHEPKVVAEKLILTGQKPVNSGVCV